MVVQGGRDEDTVKGIAVDEGKVRGGAKELGLRSDFGEMIALAEPLKPGERRQREVEFAVFAFDGGFPCGRRGHVGVGGITKRLGRKIHCARDKKSRSCPRTPQNRTPLHHSHSKSNPTTNHSGCSLTRAGLSDIHAEPGHSKRQPDHDQMLAKIALLVGLHRNGTVFRSGDSGV